MAESEEAPEQLKVRSSSEYMAATRSSTSTETWYMNQVMNRMQGMMFTHGKASYRSWDCDFCYGNGGCCDHVPHTRVACYAIIANALSGRTTSTRAAVQLRLLDTGSRPLVTDARTESFFEDWITCGATSDFMGRRSTDLELVRTQATPEKTSQHTQ